MYRNLPNLLTGVRLILGPMIGWAIWSGEFRIAAGLVFAAGWSDALDGFLARRFRWTSRLGSYMDPIADKLLLVVSYAALGLQGAVPAWLVWLILGRDALILAMVAVAFLFTNVRSFPPSPFGKLCTIVQVCTALLVIADRAFVTANYGNVERGLVWITATVTLLSGLHYTWRGFTEFPAARRARS